MNVLIVGPKSIHVSSFIEALNKQGITPSFLTEERCDYSTVREEKVISFRSPGIDSYKAYKAVKRWIRELNPDCVHVHQANRLAFVVIKICKSLNINVVLTAWGSDVLTVPLRSFFHRWLTKFMLKNSQVITADSMDMINAMNSIYPSGKYVHVQYGIEVLEAGNKENIVYSNRLHKAFYRIDQIITYFNAFQKDFPDWKLVIAGKGDMTPHLQQQVDELKLNGSVSFVGWLNSSENQEWYKKSKIYISIPESDGTSVSLLEAMSAGCIPIVPDLKVSHEWIENGVNGVIEGKKNPMVEAVRLNWNDCYKANRQIVLEKASREKCTQSFINLYHND